MLVSVCLFFVGVSFCSEIADLSCVNERRSQGKLPADITSAGQSASRAACARKIVSKTSADAHPQGGTFFFFLGGGQYFCGAHTVCASHKRSEMSHALNIIQTG